VLGSILSQASEPHPVAVAPAYYYYDPWCQERFSSLADYDSHFYRHHHPRVVRVVSVNTGACVDTYHWRHGDWRRGYDGDWDD
jgi:hypothetical protein